MSSHRYLTPHEQLACAVILRALRDAKGANNGKGKAAARHWLLTVGYEWMLLLGIPVSRMELVAKANGRKKKCSE